MSSLTLFNEMERMRSDVMRLFGEPVRPGPWRLAFLPGISKGGYPLLNVSEMEGGFRVVALAPGVDPESFDITVKGNVLRISGVKEAPNGVNPDEYHRFERSGGRFVRSLELPGTIDREKVKASYENGLLKILLEKSEAAKPRKINVEIS